MVQGVMWACFEKSTSTEQSLLLLQQFESLLQRDSFRSDLEAQYVLAFQSYAGQDRGSTCYAALCASRQTQPD